MRQRPPSLPIWRSVKDKPFIVFHDAYQYFENHFGLAAVGSISDVSAQAPSAQRLEEIRGKLKAVKAVCVFREPQYDGKLVAAVIEDTNAREGVLDPLGAALTPGPNAYQQLLKQSCCQPQGLPRWLNFHLHDFAAIAHHSRLLS